MMKKLEVIETHLTKIVGGGQALGTLPDGRKLFVWGGLPGEHVMVQLTKKKSSYAEGIVTDVLIASTERVQPRDPDSYLSTSPWQIIDFAAEQRYKAQLIREAFELHGISLPEPTIVYSDNNEYHYRNKVEFSWYGEADATSGADTLHLAFFRRGSKGKLAIEDCALLPSEMTRLALSIRDVLQAATITARQLKTLLIRRNQAGDCVWQLYVKDRDFDFSSLTLNTLAQGGEIIYSDPRSPASVITERLMSYGEVTLTDAVLGTPFRYATEGFFQVNIPVYEQALRDMQKWVGEAAVVDLYSGVGSIGLTIGGPGVTLVEINEHAVREMERNIKELDTDATAVLAASENTLEHITKEKTIIVDPPRAGLHANVIERLLEVTPSRIIYLSCNPVTQARDVALLADKYTIQSHQGYNFFPHTPHIEHLVILNRR